MAKKKKSETVTFNKKVLAGFVCLMPLVGILISKHRVGELILLIIGVGAGIFIGMNLKAK